MNDESIGQAPAGPSVRYNHGIISTGANAINTIYPALAHELRSPADTPAPPGTASFAPSGGAGRSFVGRDEELAAVTAALGADGAGNVHVVAGLGGIGKSALAERYARRHAEDGGLVWWIPAERPERIAAGLAALAHALHTETALVPDAVAAQWATAWLAAHDGWLLVLDDVAGLDDVADLCGPLTRGRFLITSRRTTGWGAFAASTRLAVLPPDHSLTLLTKLAGPELVADGGAELCRDLGHLPLALRQAGAYLEQNQVPAAVYRARLTGGVLGWTPDGADPRDTVARVWQVSLDRITEDHGPLPGRILGILSWLAPDAIPLDLLAWDGLGLGQQEVDEAIGRLSAYGLVSRSGTEAGIHRLVQLVSRSAPQATTPSAAHQATTALRGTVPLLVAADFEHWANLRRQLPHAQALAESTDPADDDRAAAELFSIAGTFQLLQGAGEAGAAHLRRALAFLESDPADNPERHAEHTRVSLALAQATLRTGAFATAIEALEATLKRAEHHLGPTHRDTLTAMSTLGMAYDEAGRHEEAEELLTAAVAGGREALDADDPVSWSFIRPLAGLLAGTGRAPAAVGLMEPIAERARQTFGPGHPHTLLNLHALATAYSQAADHERASALLQEITAATAAALGAENIRVLVARNALGIAHLQAGRWDEAVSAFETNSAVLDDTELEQVTAFRMRLNLAMAYAGQGRHAAAIPVLRDAIARVGHLDDFDPRALAGARTALAMAQSQNGEAAAAAELFPRCLAEYTALYGPDHVETVAVHVFLASALSAVGGGDSADATAATAATEEWERCLAACARALPADSPLHVTALAGAAKAYETLPDLARAAALYAREAELHATLHGPDDPRRLAAARNAATSLVLTEDADFEAAAAEFETLLADHIRILGRDDLGTLAMRVRTAQAHEKGGNLPRALDLHIESTAEMARVQGPEHANIGRSRAREDAVRSASGLPVMWAVAESGTPDIGGGDGHRDGGEDGSAPPASPASPAPDLDPAPAPDAGAIPATAPGLAAEKRSVRWWERRRRRS